VPGEEKRHARIGADAVAKPVDEEKPGPGEQQHAGDDGQGSIEAVAVLEVGVDVRSLAGEKLKRRIARMRRIIGARSSRRLDRVAPKRIIERR
jgi:hypothetical protein